MAEEFIDFDNSGRKILINPVVPLQIINIYARSGQRVQATLLGRVYTSAIQILEIVPTALVQNDQIQKLDFPQHQKAVENLRSVYSTLQIIGVVVTNLQANQDLATLHTIYFNKQSGFKAQGILTFPIILSISTNINQQSSNIQMHAYIFNKAYLHCKNILNVVAFQQLSSQISFGDADIEGISPLFSAIHDQEQIVPDLQPKQMIKLLAKKLNELRLHCQHQGLEDTPVKIRSILDRINTTQDFSMEQLSYLLEYANLQTKIAMKINRFQKQ